MKRLNLVIDGNHFLYKTLFVIPRAKGNKDRLLDHEDEIGIFIRKLSQDLAFELRKFTGIINRVVFTLDSSSWRKSVLPEEDYKGNRVPNDGVNWEKFYHASEEFQKILKKRNVIVSKSSNAEGDDLIFAWCKYLQHLGESCMIYSGDRDMMQLVNCNKQNNTFSVFYTSTQKRFVAYQEFEKWLNEITEQEVDIFNLAEPSAEDSLKVYLRNFIKANNLEYEEILATEFIFKKVLQGDKGDNIPPIYSWKKGERTYSLNSTQSEKIYQKYLVEYNQFQTDDFFENDKLESIIDYVIDVLKLDKELKESLVKKLEINVQLAFLSHKTIPKEVFENMFNVIKNEYKMPLALLTELYSKDTILKDTEYLKENTPKSFDFIKGNDDTDFSFIKSDNHTDTKALF